MCEICSPWSWCKLLGYQPGHNGSRTTAGETLLVTANGEQVCQMKCISDVSERIGTQNKQNAAQITRSESERGIGRKRNPSAAESSFCPRRDRTGFTQSRIDSGRWWQMPLIYLCDSPPKSQCGHRITEKIIFGARRLAGDLLETYQKENLRPQTTPNAVGATQLSADAHTILINWLIRNLRMGFKLWSPKSILKKPRRRDHELRTFGLLRGLIF